MSNEDKALPEKYITFKKEFLQLLEDSNHDEAYMAIRSIFYYPGSFDSDKVWIDALGLLVKFTRAMQDESLEDLLESVIDDPKNVNSLYKVAYELYEQRAHGIAATFLKKADEIKPQDPKIINELVSNLEALLLNKDACEILSNAKEALEKSELSRYLNAYNHLMIANLEVPAKMLPTIQGSSDPNIQFMAKSLKGMLDRARVLKKTRSLDDRDLRGWHLVLNGSILLHYSPFAINDGMHGRYAYISDSPSLCKDGIERIKKLIEISNLNLPQIISLPDRSSTILAHATAKMLDKPLINYDDLQNDITGLVVAYDLDLVQDHEILTNLHLHEPGQVLWAHVSCWTNPYPYAPDITTYLCEKNASFWGGERMVFDQNTKQVSYQKPDESSIEEIAQQIIDARIDEEYIQDSDDLISLIKNLDQLEGYSKVGIYQSNEKRLRQRLGSPVPSNRFMR